METDPTPQPLVVRVDQRQYEDITSVIVEEGVITLADTTGWVTSIAPGSWSRAERRDDTPPTTEFGGNPRNLP